MNNPDVGLAENPIMDFEAEAHIRAALAPTAEGIRGLRLSSNTEIANELLKGKGTRALDIGCGDGKFTRVLATIFEDVDGVDVSARKIDEAQGAADAIGLKIKFQTGSGEELPYPDGSFDVVVFSNSLHHISDMDRALRQSARVLVPNGFLYIMEPVPAGSFFEATKFVSDETEVRTAAYRAIGQALKNGFAPVTEVMYRSQRQFADFAEWSNDQIERSESRRLVLETRGDEARRLFERNAQRKDGRLVFDQIFRVNLLRRSSR